MASAPAKMSPYIICPETGRRVDPRYVEKHIAATWPLPIDERNGHNAGALARIAALRQAAKEALE